MFCAWRKSPLAPCGCAYRLHGSTGELLNHFGCLGEGTLVLRQRGLSLAKLTCFGLSIASRASGWQVLHDRWSGLETDTRRLQGFYLLREPVDSRPVLGMAEPGRALHLSVRLENHAWDSPAIRDLIRRFHGIPLDCLESRQLGAGAWLDEWEGCPCPTSAGERLGQAREILKRCDHLEVAVASGGQRGVADFTPTFFDCSGTVLRIADRGLRHVVHADVDDPGFRLQQLDAAHLRLSNEAVAA